MAGTEETSSEETKSSDAQPSADGGGAGGVTAQPERSVDTIKQAIVDLTKGDLSQRVIVGRNWLRGVDDGDGSSALAIVQRACKEWLEEYTPPQERPLTTCAECGGGETHLPDCVLLRRSNRR